METIPAKACSKCGETKPLDQFAKNPTATSGLRANCKACDSAYRASRKEAHAEYERNWRALNHEGVLARAKQYREDHREEINKKHRRYRRSNPDMFQAYDRSRRARIRAVPSEKVILRDLIFRDQRRCRICGLGPRRGRSGAWSVDHIVPVSKGGANLYANVQLAHRGCNSRRGNRGPGQMRLLG